MFGRATITLGIGPHSSLSLKRASRLRMDAYIQDSIIHGLPEFHYLAVIIVGAVKDVRSARQSF